MANKNRGGNTGKSARPMSGIAKRQLIKADRGNLRPHEQRAQAPRVRHHMC